MVVGLGIGLTGLLLLKLTLGRVSQMLLLQTGRWGKLLLLLCVLSLATLSWGSTSRESAIAYKAGQYKRLMYGYGSVFWGAGKAPLALLAAQIHQESRWNPEARSKYACGLTQFTPDTAKWISAKYRTNVGEGVCTSPSWALKAQAAYMWELGNARQKGANSDCDRWRFALRDYNGGAGWINRDKALAFRNGANPGSASEVARFNAGRAPEFFKENTTYDVMILTRWQPLYTSWGGAINCEGII